MLCAVRLMFEACTDGIKLHRRVGGINETGSATILGEIDRLGVDVLVWTRAACEAARWACVVARWLGSRPSARSGSLAQKRGLSGEGTQRA